MPGTLAPMWKRTRRVAPALICGTALLLTGCGSGWSGGSTADNDSDAGQSPLRKYLGDGYRADGPAMMAGAVMMTTAGFGPGGVEPSAEQKRKQRAVEDEVAECMQAEGFEYTPVYPESRGSTKRAEAYALDKDEFTERYGYGLTTLGMERSDPDPNQKYVQSLSEKAKKAYQEALIGPMLEAEVQHPEGGKQKTVRIEVAKPGSKKSGKQADPGCLQKAHEQVFGERTNRQQEFSSLFEDLATLHQRIQRDPAMVEAYEKWAGCMRGAGYDGFRTPEDATNSIFQKLNGGGAAPSEKVQQYELEVAGADLECQQKHVDKVAAEVRQRHEERFVEDHKSALVRYKNWRAKAGKEGR